MLESIALLVMSGLSGVVPAHAIPSAALAQEPAHPTIVHLVSRDQVVTIRAGHDGPLYSVTQTDGKVLLANASEAELAKLQPDVYRRVKQATAGISDMNGFATADLQ